MFGAFIDNIKNKFQDLTPEEKRKVVITIVIVFLIVVGLLAYSINRGGKGKADSNRTAAVYDLRPLGSPDQLTQSQYVEMQAYLEQMRREMEELKTLYNRTIEEQVKKVQEEREKEKRIMQEAMKTPPPPPPPPPPPAPPATLPQVTREGMPPGMEREGVFVQQATKQEIGGIKVVQGKGEDKDREKTALEVSTTAGGGNVTGNVTGVQRDLKKKIYLPPSFMEATLLSGLDAPAVTKGQGHPVPVLLRVNTPAVLPNMVKANLKGCFVIAEGLGNLASERVDLRLVSLSCIDRKGRAVIDQPIAGFVVDSDGKIGLRGKVVSKMGSAVVRSMIAGLFSGLGQSLVSTNQNLIISPSGTLSAIDPERALSAGLGTGISRAMEQISRFYLELAQQTIPVIEVLPTRKVTVIISRGVNLDLKEYDLD
ncbi:MAG: TraB/VirB10 family protein [Desulfurococcaceae archaeon]